VLNAVDADTCTGTFMCASNAGQCKLVNGQICGIPSDCANNNCTTYYPDADNDGFGSAQSSQKICSSSVPSGYSTTNTDCCDSDGRAYPNAAPTNSQFLNGSYGWYYQANNCGSFDYNCSGNVQMANFDSQPICNATCSNYYCVDSGCGTGLSQYYGGNGQCQAAGTTTGYCK
jgi:hypothetical protein